VIVATHSTVAPSRRSIRIGALVATGRSRSSVISVTVTAKLAGASAAVNRQVAMIVLPSPFADGARWFAIVRS
jgi:hypothetical protein